MEFTRFVGFFHSYHSFLDHALEHCGMVIYSQDIVWEEDFYNLLEDNRFDIGLSIQPIFMLGTFDNLVAEVELSFVEYAAVEEEDTVVGHKNYYNFYCSQNDRD